MNKQPRFKLELRMFKQCGRAYWSEKCFTRCQEGCLVYYQPFDDEAEARAAFDSLKARYAENDEEAVGCTHYMKLEDSWAGGIVEGKFYPYGFVMGYFPVLRGQEDAIREELEIRRE